MQIPDGPMLVVEDYEYGIQHYSEHREQWEMTWTNHYDGWYPSEKSMKNALAQLRAPRWGHEPSYKYRAVRRPVGAIEVI